MRQDRSIEAYLDDYGKVTIHVSHRFYHGKVESFYLKNSKGVHSDCVIRSVVDHTNYTQYDCIIPAELDLGLEYIVVDNHGFQAPLQIRFIVRTRMFDETYAYNGTDLGNTYHPTGTTFAVWAPTAHRVECSIIKHGEEKVYPMKRSDKGVYRLHVEEDLKNSTYTYLVHVNDEIHEATDPYAISCTSNGSRSAILDSEDFVALSNSDLPVFEHPVDAILYEISVRDMTSSSTSGNKKNGKYEGLIERNTKNNGRATGFDYIRLLGVTHVQLMPVYDFATIDEDYPNRQYNWGYDPLNYFCPEGSYSSNPNHPLTRVNELRKVVNAFHEVGIRVNLDLVLNHHYDLSKANLNLIVPFYYFRYHENGSLSNGSFCGNDTDSCRMMMRKYMIDNVKMWINCYGVDGFRFDLMGILDVDTMNEITKESKKLKPDCMVYGEGWNLPTYLSEENKACISNNAKMPDVGHFNDYFRDAIKGKSSENESYAKGYCTGDGDLAYNVASSFCGNVKSTNAVRIFQEPSQSINYVECHDNQTCWDKIKDCCKEDTREIRIKKHKMCIASVMFAQGVPFLHAGQEFCRTKLGYHNTYNIPDSINQMDWDRMIRYEDVVQYTRTCIILRKKFEAFRLRSALEIDEKVSFDYLDANILVVTIHHNESKWNCKGMKIVLNPFGVDRHLHFDEKCTLLLDENGLVKKLVSSQDIQIKAHSLLVCAIM
ncbi:MAG: type I pullulanase [Anaerorhabdus sp.]|uniref:type I pullulanase n=1 Tax=Anaerorhabdus sp. TaxID=1872524 RepID=UPI002FC939B8